MTNFDQATQMELLLKQHANAKSQMNKGITLSIVGFCFIYFGLCFVLLYGLGLLLMVPGILMHISGLKKAIRGSRARFRANFQINRLRSSGYVESDGIFIPDGEFIHVEQQTNNSNVNFCVDCGGKVEAGDLFCPHCGTPIKQ